MEHFDSVMEDIGKIFKSQETLCMHKHSSRPQVSEGSISLPL